jgi:hypothetical protein
LVLRASFSRRSKMIVAGVFAHRRLGRLEYYNARAERSGEGGESPQIDPERKENIIWP